MATLPLLDETVFQAINRSEQLIEENLDCELMYFYGEIRSSFLIEFRNFVESLVGACADSGGSKKRTLSVCLKRWRRKSEQSDKWKLCDNNPGRKPEKAG